VFLRCKTGGAMAPGREVSRWNLFTSWRLDRAQSVVGRPTSSPESFAELMDDVLYLLVDERTKTRVALYPQEKPGAG
jgi:hypothetical protein